MKMLRIIGIALVFFFSSALQAQISVKVHIGTPPSWGPAGYSNVRYYYLPDVQAYYDIQTSMFIYPVGNRWVHRSYLPSRYRNYDLYNGYKVVMTDYRGTRPYTYYKTHRVKYAKGYRGHEQRNIGERPGRGHSNRVIHTSTPSYRNVDRRISKPVERRHIESRKVESRKVENRKDDRKNDEHGKRN